MLDEVARFNKERWEELAAADIQYSRPWLDLDVATARQRMDPLGLLGDISGKRVLCLGSGGGQQSAAFSVLGAQVTVLDLTENQLAGDRLAASHYGLTVRTEQGDMRDLACFADGAFDLVYHGYSINFVPDPTVVFQQVTRVLQPGGPYFLQWHNPFTQGIDETTWDGHGYRISRPYRDEEILAESYSEPNWTVEDASGNTRLVQGPREFRHTLSTVINGLAEYGFHIIRCQELTTPESDPKPGSWEHCKLVTAWVINLWTIYQPSPYHS